LGKSAVVRCRLERLSFSGHQGLIARLVCRRVAVTADGNRCHRLFQLRTGSRRWVVAVAFSMARAGTDAGDRGADARAGVPFCTGRRKSAGLVAGLT
jgi:hypothetical protein